MSDPEHFDCDDRCWGIISLLEAERIEGRIEWLTNGVPYVRVLLDDYLVIDCQIDLNAEMRYSVYLRRYTLDGSVGEEYRPYQANTWEQAAKCIELAHRVHERRIEEDMRNLVAAVEGT
jgi:hypothetical protein